MENFSYMAKADEKGQPVNVTCVCGATLTINNFPEENETFSKRDIIELSQYHRLQDCPKCNPLFTGEMLNFKPAVSNEDLEGY